MEKFYLVWVKTQKTYKLYSIKDKKKEVKKVKKEAKKNGFKVEVEKVSFKKA